MTGVQTCALPIYASGTINIDDVYDEMMEKMNAAGLQDIIEDAQAQLDAYLASK